MTAAPGFQAGKGRRGSPSESGSRGSHLRLPRPGRAAAGTAPSSYPVFVFQAQLESTLAPSGCSPHGERKRGPNCWAHSLGPQSLQEIENTGP